jgi:hypothetical protein
VSLRDDLGRRIEVDTGVGQYTDGIDGAGVGGMVQGVHAVHRTQLQVDSLHDEEFEDSLAVGCRRHVRRRQSLMRRGVGVCAEVDEQLCHEDIVSNRSAHQRGEREVLGAGIGAGFEERCNRFVITGADGIMDTGCRSAVSGVELHEASTTARAQSSSRSGRRSRTKPRCS